MNKCILILILVFSFGCMNEKSANGSDSEKFKSFGNDQGNGSDNVDFTTPTAWFLGDKEVRYCIDIGSDFGLSRSEALKEIEGAFEVWKKYIISKNINEEILKYNDVRERVNAPRIKDLKGLFTRSKYVGICSNAHDLAFYLGVDGDGVTEAKRKYSNPWSFAMQRKYDPVLRWGNGFIWVAKEGHVFPNLGLPNWSLSNRFKGIIIHELGHVSGVGHIEGTIMRSDFSSLMKESRSQVNEYVRRSLTEIDFPEELFLQDFNDAHYDFEGSIGLPDRFGNPYSPEKTRETFKLFTGVEPVGEVSTHLLGNKLILSDSNSAYGFDLVVNQEDKLDFDSQFIFGHHQADENGSEGYSWLFHNSQVIPGTIKTKDQKEILINLERNVWGANVIIHYFIGAQKHFLFYPNLPLACNMIEIDGVPVCQ